MWQIAVIDLNSMTQIRVEQWKMNERLLILSEKLVSKNPLKWSQNSENAADVEIEVNLQLNLEFKTTVFFFIASNRGKVEKL